MGRNVFFSFHYADVSSFRANVVRNSWVTHNKRNIPTFSDGSIWEEALSKGVKDLKNLIENVGLFNTSVTSVLIGSETNERRYVRYELVKSFEKGNGILAIHINRIKGKDGKIIKKGANPLDKLGFKINEETNKLHFYELQNGKWVTYKDLPSINNRKSNTVYIKPLTSLQKIFGSNKLDKFYKFSDIFQTYCWVNDQGKDNFSNWVESASKNIII